MNSQTITPSWQDVAERWQKCSDEFEAKCSELTTQVEALTKERDELRAEVAKLTEDSGTACQSADMQRTLYLQEKEAREAAEAKMMALRAAANAVVQRWDTPNWKDVENTAAYIGTLRAALAASE